MGDILGALLSELEACRGEATCKSILDRETPHVLNVPLDHKTCDELQALGRVFDCEPSHLAFVILRSAVAEIHEGLDEDLDRMAVTAQETVGAGTASAIE